MSQVGKIIDQLLSTSLDFLSAKPHRTTPRTHSAPQPMQNPLKCLFICEELGATGRRETAHLEIILGPHGPRDRFIFSNSDLHCSFA